jgi:O-antigen ligase
MEWLPLPSVTSNSDPHAAGEAAATLLAFIAEGFFLVMILSCALIPGVAWPTVRVGDQTIMGSELAVMASFPLMLALLWPTWRMERSWWPILTVMVLTVLYGILSAAMWSGIEIRAGFMGQMVVMLCTLSAMGSACLLVGAQPAAGLPRMLDRFAMLVAAITVVYVIKSWYAAALGLNFIHLQEQRTGGPLASPAVLHFVILPPLGWSLARLLASLGRERRMHIIITAILAVGLLSSRSRGALLGLGISIFLGVLLLRDAQMRRRLMVVVGVIIALVVAVFYLQPNTDRLAQFTDNNRQMNFDAVVRALTFDPGISLRGWGLGHFWNWYRTDVMSITEGPSIYEFGFLHIETQFGTMLYHPHSLPLFLLAELGLVGAITIVVVFGTLVRAGLRPHSTAHGLLAAGLLGSTTALVFDLLIFKGFPSSALWWVFVFACLRRH